MRFRVLGATELESGETCERIGSERQRRLLTALAMHAPAAVAIETLLEAVWGDRRPAHERNALQTVVTRLRQTLDAVEVGAGERIVMQLPGYALDVPAEEIDANRFAELAAAGRRHLAAGDHERARAVLAEAIDLWGGTPFAEFADEVWAHGEAARSERWWVAVREADIEARLEAGLHAEVLGDVQGLIEEEPYSDGPRALLMRALYGSGRQAEALRAFQEYRALMAEELGLEPGRDLVRLEQRIVANDPSLLPADGRALRGYRLHEQLRATDRGAVFRATQPGVERDVAIEVVDEELAADADFVRSFELQGQALAQLGHAHVVPVHDLWRDPGGAYLVSRLLTGGSLADPEVVGRLGRDGLERVVAQVRSALDAAHRVGLVHGPIEAADIQLDEHDTAYLSNFRLGSEQSTAADDDHDLDRFVDQLLGPVTVRRPSAPLVANPYRGLEPFLERDAGLFFGREGLVDETLETLDRRGAAVLVGPSGCGKSSIARGGVVPALAADRLEGSADWFVTTMVPGTDPFAELEAALLRIAVRPPAALRERLRDPTRPLVDVVERLIPGPAPTVVLVVDQFEELFTQTPADERDRFLDALAGALTAGSERPAGSLKVVATLRADHYDRPLAHPAATPIVARATVAVGAMSGEERRAAIVGPAALVGVDVDPDLAARLVADAGDRAGSLPLLEYTLTELFDTRHGDRMTLEDYLATGGLAGAIATRAERIHDSLDPGQRQACRRLFGRLVSIDVGPDTRRRVRLSELRSAERDPAGLDVVVDRFVQARLLVTDRDPATREPTLEVAHEALLREWPRLTGWIDDDREAITALRHLSDAAARWQSTGDDGDLPRGARLAAAIDLAEEHGERLTPDERAFVAAGRERAEAEQTAERRTNRRLRGLLAATGVLLVAALVAVLIAADQRDRADERAGEAARAAAAEAEARATADLERLVAVARNSGDVPWEVAILAGLEAHRIDPSPDTLNALHTALTTDPGYRGRIGSDPMGGDITALDDGRRIVTHTPDRIEMWDVEARRQVGSWPFPGAEAVTNRRELHSTASGDGARLVATTPVGTTVIDAATGEELAAIDHGPRAVAVALSPDASRVAVGFGAGTGRVEIWDVVDPTAPVASRPSPDGAAVPSLAWQPDGERLALASTSGEVALWEPQNGVDTWVRSEVPPVTYVSGIDVAPQLLFSAAGDRLVVAGVAAPGEASNSPDASILVLSTGDGSELANVPSGRSMLRSLAWLDTDETAVLTTSQTGPVLVTDLERETTTRRDDIAATEAAAVLPASGLIVTEAGSGLELHAADEANALIRRLPLRTAFPDGSPDDIVVMLLDAAGERLLATNVQAVASYVIDPGTPGADWQRFTDPQGSGLFAILAAGDRILAAGTDGWNHHDWSGRPFLPALDLHIPPDANYVTLGPAGERVFYTADDQDVLIDLSSDPATTIARLPRLERPYVCCAAPQFSTDGALLSRLDRVGGTEVYDAVTGERVAFDHPYEARLFGPRGSWFAVVDELGTIHFHDQTTGERLGASLVGNQGSGTTLHPSPDGRRLATVGADGSVRVWDLETRAQLGRPLDAASVPALDYWSGDGRSIAIRTEAGDAMLQIEVLDYDTENWPTTACELVGRNMTEAEWEQYGPRTLERRATCPEYPLP